MATIKSYTDLEQSKKLAEILPLESADMFYPTNSDWEGKIIGLLDVPLYIGSDGFVDTEMGEIHAWSLTALLNILHSRAKDIPSLSGGGYKDGKYISDWCLDYEFENGDYKKTFADNPVDACVDMIEKLHELKML